MNVDGKGLIEQQISAWLRKTIIFNTGDHGSCSKVLLRHLSVDRKPQGDVASFPVRFDESNEEEIQPLINAIVDAAQKDADDLNAGLQSYGLYAVFPQDISYVPRKVIRVAANDSEIERDIMPSEPPTEKGMVAQLMRHNESIMKTAAVSQGYMTQSLQAENRRLSEMVEKFSQQQIDFMVLMQETVDHTHQRRLAEKESEINMALKEGTFANLKAIIPIIANRIAGKPIMPEPSREFMLMSSLFENMTQEQQTTLLSSLSPSQASVLSEILSEYEKKKDMFLDGVRKVEGGEKAVELAKDLAAPAPGSKKMLAASPKAVPNDKASPAEKAPRVIPMHMTLEERVAKYHNEDPGQKDPSVKKLEDGVLAFTSRFKDILGKKTPTQGDM